jgi:hypothetical protein
MASRVKFGVAAAMMLLVFATAPAVLCASYMAQSARAHSCCPPTTAPGNTAAPTCCIHAPAVTSPSIDIPAPSVASTAIAVDPLVTAAWGESLLVQDFDTSPPLCNSILRI